MIYNLLFALLRKISLFNECLLPPCGHFVLVQVEDYLSRQIRIEFCFFFLLIFIPFDSCRANNSAYISATIKVEPGSLSDPERWFNAVGFATTLFPQQHRSSRFQHGGAHNPNMPCSLLRKQDPKGRVLGSRRHHSVRDLSFSGPL